jgi:RpiB/LacA/LacB family sugar-phosphate isomerase
MRIAIGADHAGFSLKERVREILSGKGHAVVDFGTDGPESADYPDFAAAVGHSVVSGEADRGILVCSTGVGMSMAANKIHGVRAAVGVNAEEVGLTRGHNDANILALGAKYTDEATAAALIDVFLNTPFEGGRHARRVAKMIALEETEKGTE